MNLTMQADFSSLASFIESRLHAEQKKKRTYDGEFEVESIIGVKADPDQEGKLLYLTTFVGYVHIALL